MSPLVMISNMFLSEGHLQQVLVVCSYMQTKLSQFMTTGLVKLPSYSISEKCFHTPFDLFMRRGGGHKYDKSVWFEYNEMK